MADHKNYSATSLVGGGSDALDRTELDGALLNERDIAITFELSTGTTYVHVLDADSGLPASYPDVIIPLLNPGTKRWVKLSSFDDYTKYSLIDGTAPFTSTVSGVTPTQDNHLSTKGYVDTEIDTLSGSIVLVHGNLLGLTVDDHPQYPRTNGSRGFTNTVSGVTPIYTYDLATKNYVDSKLAVEENNTAIANGVTNVSATFSGAMGDLNYALTYTLMNTVDANPAQYGMITTTTTVSGFTVSFSDPIDGDNYYLSWRATDLVGVGGGSSGITEIVQDTSPQLGGNLDMNGFTIETVSAVEIDYLSGVTSNIQTQFNDLADEITTASGDILSYVSNNYIDNSEMTTISGDLNAKINDKMSDLVDDTSPQLGGNLELNAFNFVYSATPSSSGTYEGDIKTVTVDDSDSDFSMPLYCASDGHYDRANATAVGTMPCRVMALESTSGSKKVLYRGQICKTSWSWTQGGTIYVDASAGGLTQTPPAGSGNVVQIVGYALSATAMYFNPEYSVIVLA